MRPRNAFYIATVLLLLSSMSVAQTNQIQGNVKFKNPDGSLTPGAKINVDIYRVNIVMRDRQIVASAFDFAPGEWHVTTDKTGHWTTFITAAGGTYLVLAWGEGRSPNYINNVAGTTTGPIDIILEPGDGKHPTKDELRNSIRNRGAGDDTSAIAAQQAEGAKRQQEAEAQHKAAVEKAKSEFESMKQHYEQGNKFFDANDFTNAIAEFKQAAAIDDSQHVVFAKLAQATFNLGADYYNKSTHAQSQGKPADAQTDRAEAEKLWLESTNAGEKAVSLQESNQTFTEIHAQTLKNYGIRFGKPDAVEKACALYYKIAEGATTPADKANAYIKAGNAYFESGNTEKAGEAFNKALAVDAKNVKAIYGLGLTMVSSTDEARIKEGLNFFAKVVEIGQPNSKEVTDAKAMIQQIKDAYNLMPQPGSKTGKRKG